MSSILEALRELEEHRGPARQHEDGGWPDEPGTPRWLVPVLAIVGLVGAGGGVFLWSRTTPSAPPPAALVQPVTPPAAVALPPVAPLPSALLDTEPPRARVAPRATPAPVGADTPERPVAVAARPAWPHPDASTTPRPPGEPHVQVSSISYSPVAEQRTVTLTVDGGRPVTLREGDLAGNVEVQLIMTDRVYVRHAGQIFAVER
jgi:hypothetical protein